MTVRIAIVLELQKNLWPVYLDGSDVEDAILNISINAMHAIKGSGQLTISTHNQVISEADALSLSILPGDYVSIAFCDTGCGMDAEIKEKYLIPFLRQKETVVQV